jgi:hypothetical protein
MQFCAIEVRAVKLRMAKRCTLKGHAFERGALQVRIVEVRALE